MADDFDDIMASLGSDADCAVTAKGKNARSDVVAYGMRFDSKEELDVYEWMAEAKGLGFIDSIEYQPKSFELFEGARNAKGKYMIRPHVYTADFHVKFTDRWVEFRNVNKIKYFDKFDEKDVFCDVKGTWSRFSDGRDFNVNMKWVYAKYGVYVWKVIPIKLFEKTWLPKNCVLTRKTKKISSKYAKFKTFENHSFVQVG